MEQFFNSFFIEVTEYALNNLFKETKGFAAAH